MITVEVKLKDNSYPVYLGSGLLAEAELFERHLGSGKTLIVSNDLVAGLYLEKLRTSLGKRSIETLILPDGERFKTMETWYSIIDKLVEIQARRDVNIIALGGGVIGDMAGFAAACYMRGVRFLQCPTTLLAQVDASVGGKTAINHAMGKNLVGAFYQPAAVIIDSDTLASLPEREFSAGLAEVVKYGAINDLDFFVWLEEHSEAIKLRQEDAINHLIHESVKNKAEIVSLDEKEAGVRALLNFGHSFGHALEAESEYSRFLHGEAVSIGMVTASRLSENRGLCQTGTANRIAKLLQTLGLPVNQPADIQTSRLIKAMALDKKALTSGLRLVLLNAIGDAVVDKQSSEDDIRTVLEQSVTAPTGC